MRFPKKTFLLTLSFLFVLIFLGFSSENAISAVDVPIFENVEDFRSGTGYEEAGTTEDTLVLIGYFFSILLGLLGVIALVLIVIGGFKWMTAGGSDEKIGEAKKLMTQGIIGLVIVFAAYAIAMFVLNQLASKFLESPK